MKNNLIINGILPSPFFLNIDGLFVKYAKLTTRKERAIQEKRNEKGPDRNRMARNVANIPQERYMKLKCIINQ